MHLFWKQFTRTICLIMLVFALFGGMLLYSSFEMSIREEENRITQDIRMFQYAICSSLSGLPEDYEAVDYAVAQIGESIVNTLGTERETVHIYREDGQRIYSSSQDFRGMLGIGDVDDADAVYEVVQMKETHFLESLSRLTSSRGVYYLAIDRDIEYIYVNRENLYRRYCIILAGTIVVSAILTFLFTAGFIRPILRLSRQTRRFAGGDYDSRIAVRGNDEITRLMEDFNEMADRLVENMHELEAHARQQEEFTAAFAHELKTPLTSIVGYADMLRMMRMPEEEVRMCGDYIFRQSTRLESLSYKMLELVGIGRQRMQWRSVPAGHLAGRAVEMLETAMKERDIRVETDMREGSLWGDEDLLLSLLGNLLDNSRKACDRHGKICLKGMKKDVQYEIRILDNGRGIPAKDLDKIKEAFYMVDKSRARREGGAGIGMALCERIIRLHGGSWRIESEPGRGTAVTVILPSGQEPEGMPADAWEGEEYGCVQGEEDAHA